MKTKATLIASAAVIALIASPPSAKAGDEAIAALGGFIGGVIVGTLSSDSRHETAVVIEAGHGGRRDGRYDRGRRENRNDRRYGKSHRNDRRYGKSHHNDRRYRNGYNSNRGRHGRWVYRTERRWVPGYWTYRRDRCGDSRRIWHQGRHVSSRVRVWVSIGSDRPQGHHRNKG